MDKRVPPGEERGPQKGHLLLGAEDDGVAARVGRSKVDELDLKVAQVVFRSPVAKVLIREDRPFALASVKGLVHIPLRLLLGQIVMSRGKTGDTVHMVAVAVGKDEHPALEGQ